MSDVPGRPIWIELFTSDQATSQAFYTQLLGWSAEVRWPELDGYVTFLHAGEPVAGCMTNDTGGPDVWSVYLECADMGATVTRVEQHGGAVVVEPMPISDLGTQAFVTDPGGATVGLWQPRRLPGFVVQGEPGAPGWFELLTSSYEASVDFYEEVLGWWTHPVTVMAGARAVTLGRDDDALAGIIDGETLLPGTPSQWQFYLRVADTDATAELALRLGGAVVMAPAESPYGRLSTLLDPGGVPFTVMGPSRVRA